MKIQHGHELTLFLLLIASGTYLVAPPSGNFLVGDLELESLYNSSPEIPIASRIPAT
jgi:hypothetical protein